MDRSKLVGLIRKRKTFLCVGIDPDMDKLPEKFQSDKEGIYHFCKEIIDATRSHCVAYKFNLAFFECYKSQGLFWLEDLVKYVGDEHFTIADAKRGDIGNTADKYAETFFDSFGFDAVTVTPYMGKDAVVPFLGRKNKWAIVLGCTSNKGAEDIQMIETSKGEFVYQKVVRDVASWGSAADTMLVVGATVPEQMKEVRKIAPDHFFLVPGVGAQGGKIEEVVKSGLNENIGLLISASRSVLYASNSDDFALSAKEEAKRLQEEMQSYI